MREGFLIRNHNVVPIGSREWREWRLRYQEPDWYDVLPGPAKGEVTDKLPIPETMRQFMRNIGQRGGRQRSRNFARRDFRKGVRFWQRYGSSPDKVVAAPVKANAEERRGLLTYASRGGQARARNCSPEQLKAIAAMGGRAKAEKAAKLKQPALCASAIAAKQPKG